MSKPSTNRKVLAYLIGSLGDTIVAIPALRALRRQYSDAEIVLLQNIAGGNVVQAAEVVPSELVDRHLSYRSSLSGFDQLREYASLWYRLRRERFDTAAYLVISERPEVSVKRDRRFFRSCGIKELLGFHSFSREVLYPTDAAGRPDAVDHEAIRKLKRLEQDGFQSSPESLLSPLLEISDESSTNGANWLRRNRSKPERPLLAIAPGCKTQANAWPIENFIEIARRAQNGFEVLIVGGKSERELAEQIIAESGGGINAAGIFSVAESSALLAKCDFYFGVDTGTTHLAAAVGTRCFVVMHERNNPGQWFPLGDGHSVVRHEVPCAGCRQPVCPVAGHPCMTGISAETAWREFQTFVRSPVASATSVIEA